MTGREQWWRDNRPPDLTAPPAAAGPVGADPCARDRADLALALVLWRYVDHTAACTMTDEARRDRAVELAKRLGIWPEFWEAIQAVDVLRITVKDLDRPPKPKGRRGRPAK